MVLKVLSGGQVECRSVSTEMPVVSGAVFRDRLWRPLISSEVQVPGPARLSRTELGNERVLAALLGEGGDELVEFSAWSVVARRIASGTRWSQMAELVRSGRRARPPAVESVTAGRVAANTLGVRNAWC